MDMCGNDMGCFAGIFFAGVAMIIYLLATIVYAGKTHKKYVNNVSAPVSSLNPVAKGFFRVFMLVTILYVGSLLMATFHYYYYDWYRFDEDTGRYYSIQGRYYYYDSDGRYHKCYPDLPMEHFWNDRCN